MHPVPPLPRQLQLEVTGACNLRCRMCLVSYRPALNKADGGLDPEVFRRVVDAAPDLEEVTLQGLGEPLLAPGLVEMIEYATARGVRVGFNTNATLLTRRWAERLVAAGLAWLHVSLDGATRETYQAVRRGSDFDRVCANVRGLMAVIRERGADRPRVSVVFVAMRRNLHELPDLVRLTADLGVPALWVQNLSHSFSDTDPAGSYRQIRAFTEREALWLERDPRVAEVFGRARELAAELGVRLRLPRPNAGPPPRASGEPGCDWPWRSAYVTHDGKVQPCCMVMGSDRATLGDVTERPFAEIWAGEPYQRFRERLLGDDPPEVCRGCSAYRHAF